MLPTLALAYFRLTPSSTEVSQTSLYEGAIHHAGAPVCHDHAGSLFVAWPEVNKARVPEVSSDLVAVTTYTDAAHIVADVAFAAVAVLRLLICDRRLHCSELTKVWSAELSEV